MEFKYRGPYMVIRPLRKACRFFLMTHPEKIRKGKGLNQKSLKLKDGN